MSRSKQQGTRWETAVVNTAIAAGLDAARHPEGGSNDHGDVWITTGNTTLDVEVKCVETGRPHVWLTLQTVKARPHAIPVVVWKRLTRAQPEHRRRTSMGAVAILDLDDLLALLARKEQP